jgi:arsenite-transporting ATPase
MSAARPFAKTFLDVSLPGDAVYDDVERLVRNLVVMNEILRDRSTTTIRLVMNPDRMVIREAQRTFTYLNLYGYLTDAVVVNRIFPAELAGGYFGEWRANQRQRLADVHHGFAPVPVVTAPYLEVEVIGPAMLDRLAGELFGDDDAAAVMYAGLAREISSENGTTTLRVAVPFAERDEISVKKVEQELVVSAGRERRTIILPEALARRTPTKAKLEEGSLLVAFSTDG